jgi:hypothetical protein
VSGPPACRTRPSRPIEGHALRCYRPCQRGACNKTVFIKLRAERIAIKLPHLSQGQRRPNPPGFQSPPFSRRAPDARPLDDPRLPFGLVSISPTVDTNPKRHRGRTPIRGLGVVRSARELPSWKLEGASYGKMHKLSRGESKDCRLKISDCRFEEPIFVIPGVTTFVLQICNLQFKWLGFGRGRRCPTGL